MDAAGVEGLREPRDDRLRNVIDDFRIAVVECEKARELVTAQPCASRRRRHQARYFGGNRLKQNVADDMTMYIVDVLEIVEIEHQQRNRLLPAKRALHERGTFVGDRASIEKAG